MGGWDIPGVLGRPLIDLDDALVQDLTTWRWLRAIGERQLREMERKENSE